MVTKWRSAKEPKLISGSYRGGWGRPGSTQYRGRVKTQGCRRKRRTVLIIDDQELIRELIKTILGEFGGWRTIEAATSHQGLAVARNRRVDLVLSDIVRPGKLDGLEFLEVFKVSHPEIPVIMVSGNADPALRYRAAWLGAYAFLPKPFTCQELLGIVENSWLERKICRTERWLRRENRRRRGV